MFRLYDGCYRYDGMKLSRTLGKRTIVRRLLEDFSTFNMKGR